MVGVVGKDLMVEIVLFLLLEGVGFDGVVCCDVLMGMVVVMVVDFGENLIIVIVVVNGIVDV